MKRSTVLFTATIFLASKEKVQKIARVKQLLAIIQRVDKDLFIPPYEDKNLAVITQPEQVPTDIEDLYMYISKVQERRNQLSFKFKASYTKEEKSFKSELYSRFKDNIYYIRQGKI